MEFTNFHMGMFALAGILTGFLIAMVIVRRSRKKGAKSSGKFEDFFGGFDDFDFDIGDISID